MPTTVVNWTEFNTAVGLNDPHIIVNGPCTVPDAVVTTVDSVSLVEFTDLGYLDFNGDSGQVVFNGPVECPYNRWIFRNTTPMPDSPTFGGTNAPSERPSVHGASASIRRPGWFGIFQGQPPASCIQQALDFCHFQPAMQCASVEITVDETGYWYLEKAINVTGRFYFHIYGDGARRVNLRADDDNGYSDPEGREAIFFQEATGGSGYWGFGNRYSDMVLSTYQTKRCFDTIVWGEGSEIRRVSATTAGHFLYIGGNAIGLLISNCHISTRTGSDQSGGFLECGPNAEEVRCRIADITVNGGSRPIEAAFIIPRGQVVIQRIHCEGCYNGVLVGPSSSDPINTGQVVIDGLDMANWPAATTSISPLTDRRSFLAVQEWDLAQVIARGLKVGSGGSGLANHLAQGDYWLSCSEDTSGRSGEIPYNPPTWGAATGDGQNVFGAIFHNTRALNTPSVYMPEIRVNTDPTIK